MGGRWLGHAGMERSSWQIKTGNQAAGGGRHRWGSMFRSERREDVWGGFKRGRMKVQCEWVKGE